MSIVDISKKSLIVVYKDEVRFVDDGQDIDVGFMVRPGVGRQKFAAAMRRAADLLEQEK